jgi:microcystin-dependent protein
VADPFIGEIRIFFGSFAPAGWAYCDGQVLSIEKNKNLFAVVGTMYGGGGQSTFALPNLRGRVALHPGLGKDAPKRELLVGEDGETNIARSGNPQATTGQSDNPHDEIKRYVREANEQLGKYTKEKGESAFSQAENSLKKLGEILRSLEKLCEEKVEAPDVREINSREDKQFMGVNFIIALDGLS